MSSSIRAFMKQLPLRRCAVCLLSLAGCIAPTTPAYAAEKVCVPVGAWVAPQYEGGGTLVIPRLMAQLARRQVVLLGETHDSFEDHRWQLQTIAALHAQRPDMVLGLEMFPRRVQAVLDRWVAGELTEQEFLKQSEWRKVWNYDPDLYLPIFHFARMNRVPMLALNVERSLTALVREKGWDAVPVEKREGVTTPAPADQAYLDELAQVFRMHAGPDKADETFDFNDPDFRRFVAGQQTWDRAMAQAISTAVSRPGAPLVVGIMGAGHIMNRYGVPHQLEDLGVADSAVLLTWDRARGCDALTPHIADTVFGTDAPEETAPQKPRLGLLLEEGKDGVTVINVAENSIAEAAGIQARDVLIEVAGLNVKNPAQVSEIVQRQAPGTWLPITLKREQHTFEIVAKFPVQK